MLNGLTAFVSGSTSGIGLGIAKRLAAANANVVLNSHTGSDATVEALTNDVAAIGTGGALYVQADMSQADSIREGLQKVKDHFGKIDILVNNAGIQFTSPVEDFPDEKWAAILALDLSSCFYSIKAVIPDMKERDFGRIINIASAHGLIASPLKAAYVAAKHGVIGLTKVVALETAEQNITCNAICPGWVDTPLVRKQIEDRAKEHGISIEDETRRLIGEKQPNMRFSTPEDIGDMVVMLSNPDFCAMTGTAVSIDGGWTAR